MYKEAYMAICTICDDTGLRNSDSTRPEFCFCAAGKQARRQWEANRGGTGGKTGKTPNPPSFIDIANLEQVNASVDAMRASLLGNVSSEPAAPTKHPALVRRPGLQAPRVLFIVLLCGVISRQRSCTYF